MRVKWSALVACGAAVRGVAAQFGIRNCSAGMRDRASLLLIVVVLSLTSHVLFLRLLPTLWQRNESADFKVFYEPVARQLANGHGFYLPSGKPALKYPPGIPVVYGATFWISDQIGISTQTGLRVLQGFLVTASSMLIAMIGFDVFGAKAGLFSCILWSVYPFHLWLSKQPSGEPLVCVLLAATILAFLRWSARGQRAIAWGAVCGVLVAFATLSKPFHIAFAIVFVSLAWICEVNCTRRTRALFSSSILMAFVLTVLPWELWASHRAGHFTLFCTNDTASMVDGLTFGIGRAKIQKPPLLPQPVAALANDFAAHRKEYMSMWDVVGRLVNHIRKSPIAVVMLFATKAAQSWYSNDSHHHEHWAALIQLFYLPLFLLGAWLARQGNRQSRNFFYIACGVTLYYWAMTTFAALAIVRYMVPAISLMIVLAGNAVYELSEAFGRGPVIANREAIAQ
jgi:Dolichyl-phosphate-mannose-protein mannosyltransferase